jgi:putative hydrolase of the HAD superfamily
MASRDLSDTVVVLDLDDTLYPEEDYRRSGLKAVSDMVAALHGNAVAMNVEQAIARGGNDVLGTICELANLPIRTKESLLWVYRLHVPTISLSGSVRSTIDSLQSSCKATLILTDGRSTTQRLKLLSLGLLHLRAYISEEWESEKPDAKRFRQIMADTEASSYVYVGDNPKKDFVAPNALGWLTIGLRHAGKSVHSQDCDGLPIDHRPQKWVTSFEEIMEFLC